MKLHVTNHPKAQPVAGTTFAYLRQTKLGKLKCAGMIPDDKRDFYALYFAGKYPENKPLGHSFMSPATGPEAQSVLIFAPEYLGDMLSEEDVRPLAVAVYVNGVAVTQ